MKEEKKQRLEYLIVLAVCFFVAMVVVLVVVALFPVEPSEEELEREFAQCLTDKGIHFSFCHWQAEEWQQKHFPNSWDIINYTQEGNMTLLMNNNTFYYDCVLYADPTWFIYQNVSWVNGVEEFKAIAGVHSKRELAIMSGCSWEDLDTSLEGNK